MDFLDRVLTCVGCGVKFIFSAGEQAYFHEKEFTHDPKRCKRCSIYGSKRRPIVNQTRAICDECGMETTVPFLPRQGRPVLCRPCFQKKPVAKVDAATMPRLQLIQGGKQDRL